MWVDLKRKPLPEAEQPSSPSSSKKMGSEAATAYFQPPLRMTRLLEGDLQRGPLAFWSVLVASETSDPDGLLARAAGLSDVWPAPRYAQRGSGPGVLGDSGRS